MKEQTFLTILEQEALDTFKKKASEALSDPSMEFRLFGSRVRGESNIDSDLDVLVLVSKTNPQIKNTLWDIANDILLTTDINLSPLVMTHQEFESLLSRERLIALNIQKEGVVL